LAFVRDGVIVTANADGSGLTTLTAGYWPAWSPDGTKIAYSAPVGGLLQIFVMNADGSGQTRLTNDSGSDLTPTWSPDGTKIAFSSTRTGDYQLFVMNADGSGQALFAASAGHDDSPSWSPDGSQLAWDASRRAHNCEIYVARIDGSGFQDISNNSACDSQPKWSPDGSTILFVSLRGRHPGIYTMAPAGTSVTRLTFNSGIDASPAWSPDGTKIVFSRNDSIMTMNSDGSGLAPVTDGTHVDAEPSWQPLLNAAPPRLSGSGHPVTSDVLAGAAQTESNPAVTGTVSHVAPVWSPQFMGDATTVSAQQARTDAHRFDLIAAAVPTFAGSTTLMHHAHPGLIILGYVNAVNVDRTESVLWPESLYARDSSGDKILSIAYGNYLMDPSNGSWVTTRQQACQAAVVAGYDGCILDVVGPSPSQPGYESSVPYDASAGADWTPQSWLAATVALSRTVRQAVTPALVYGNGVQNGPAYFDTTAPTSQLVPALDGVMVEEWLRNANGLVTAYPTLATWQQDLQMLVDIASRSSGALVVTKLWTPATTAQRQAWNLFSLATFLLATNGAFYYSFLQDSNLATTQRTYSLWNIHPGSPTEPYRSEAGYYQRDYTNGTVLVNPTTQAATVQLGATYLDLNCQPVTSVNLAPDTAAILRVTCS
jgi:Tol biopolymer transport system component